MNTEWATLQHSIQASCRNLESSGWHSILCPECGGGRDKSITGGFLLTDDTIVYKCFRGKCNTTTGMELGNFVPNKFRDLVAKLGIQIGMKLRTAKRKVIEQEEADLDSSLYEKHHLKTISVPEFWIPVADIDVPHLTDVLMDRCCRLDDVHYIDSGKYKGLLGLVHRWNNRPVGLTVFGDYTFRIDGDDGMLYTMGIDNSVPVILVEGEIDAMSFPNAVSVGGYRISPQQAYLLRGRNVIMIPEKSNKFVEQFEDYDWKLCVPNWDAGDLNEAVVKYGVLNVAQMIVDRTFDSPLKTMLEYKQWENRGYK